MSVNDTATSPQVGTNTAQPGSRPVRYILVSPDGYRDGYYSSAQEAAEAAGRYWPGVAQRDHDNGAEGWDIEVVRGE